VIRKPASAKCLRRKVMVASYNSNTVAIDGPVLTEAGLAPGSADLLDWLDTPAARRLAHMEWQGTDHPPRAKIKRAEANHAASAKLPPQGDLPCNHHWYSAMTPTAALLRAGLLPSG
jgi:hypothetical protein